MAKFWAERIEYELNRIDEVPVKLREKVKNYIEQHVEAQASFLMPKKAGRRHTCQNTQQK